MHQSSPYLDNGEHLLHRIAEEDAKAFAELYDRFFGVLYSVAISILRDESEAEDALQEVFMKVWRNAQRYSPQFGRPVTWLMTLTRNASIDRLRSRKRDVTWNVSGDDFDLFEPSHAVNEPLPIISKETAALVRGALRELPQDQRQAISLAFFTGLTQTEIADKLQQPLGTIKARIRRGMLKLRASLAGQFLL